MAQKQTFVQSQHSLLRQIIRQHAGTSLFTHLELSSLTEEKDIERLYEAFASRTPIFTPESFTNFLSNMLEEKKDPATLLSTPNLISPTPLKAAAKCREHLFPISAHHLKHFYRLEREISRRLLKRRRPPNMFYVLENPVITNNAEDVALGELTALYSYFRPFLNSLWVKPTLEELAGAGKSRYQLLHGILDQLEKAGNIEILVARPRTLVELGLLLAQREGRFVPLKELCPNLRFFIHYGQQASLYRKELSYFFKGLRNVCFVDAYLSGSGAWAVQMDFNIKHWLELRDDLGVFYEFIPAEDVAPDGKIRKTFRRLHAGGLEKGKRYLMMVSNLSGLLSCSTGDIVEVVSMEPLRIAYRYPARKLNHFREQLDKEAVESLIGEVNDAVAFEGFFIRDYLVADDVEAGHPVWILEISRPVREVNPEVLRIITNRLHTELKLHSPHYRDAFKVRTGEYLPVAHYVSMGTFAGLPPHMSFTNFDFSETAALAKAVLRHAHHPVTVQVSEEN